MEDLRTLNKVGLRLSKTVIGCIFMKPSEVEISLPHKYSIIVLFGLIFNMSHSTAIPSSIKL